MQYTIRNIPAELDRSLREQARKRGISLNDAAIEAMMHGLGVAESEPVYGDLDDLAGTWMPDPEFDAAVADQDTVDRESWR